MKKLFKPIAVFFSAALLLTSCIDNEVSDQVNRIREAQVNLLNAQTRLREADAAFREAEARQQEALAENQEIANDAALSQLELTIATNAALVAAQEEELAKAIESLRVYLLTQGAESAADLLADYQLAIAGVQDAADNIADKQAQVAKWSLLYTSALDEIEAEADAPTFDLLREKLERDLAIEEANLANQEAALVLLQEVAAGSADIVVELAELEAANQDLNNQHLALSIDLAKAENVTEDAQAAVDALTDEDGVITEFEELLDEAADLEESVAGAEEDIAAAEADITAAQADITPINNLLQPFITELTSKFTGYNSKLASAKTTAQTLKEKLVTVSILNTQGTAGTTLTNAQTAAKTALTAFEAVVGDHASPLDPADVDVVNSGSLAAMFAAIDNAIDNPLDIAAATDDMESLATLYNGATAFFGPGQPAFDYIQQIGLYDENTFVGDFEDANGVVADIEPKETPTGLQATLAEAQEELEIATNGLDANDDGDFEDDEDGDIKGLTQYQEELDAVNAQITAGQDAYDDAVAALPALEDALEAAEDAEEAIEDAQTVIENAIDQNDNVIEDLETFLGLGGVLAEIDEAANAAIEAKLDEIEETKDAIALIEEALADNEINLEKLQAYIVNLEDEIVRLQGELDALEAIAAEYLELLFAELD